MRGKERPTRRSAKPAKAKGKAKPPIVRKWRKSEGARVHDLEKRLAEALKREAEALEQQTATADILRSISASPTDYQPVFDTIVRNAGSVCGAVDALLWTSDGDELVARAHHGPIPGTIGSRQPVRGSVAGCAVSEARVVHVEDLTEADDFPVGRDIARRLGWRTTLSVPLLREGAAVGAILIRRSDVRLFTPKEIALLQTFADQAVIAIENVRLFTELEARNKDLTEFLEQQTATSDILKVIASTPTDLTPVFDTICRSAVRLFNAYGGSIRRFDGELVHLTAVVSPSPEADDRLRRRYPRPPDAENAVDRGIIERAVVHVPDTEAEPAETARLLARDFGYRRLLSVPMVREGDVVGTIAVTGWEPGPYSARQIELLKTFADQAVIAIENVRLFTELQASNRELTSALDTQTATSDILRVISRSQTDVQPVFDAIVQSAVRLCGALYGDVYRFDGELIHFVAQHNVTSQQIEPWQRTFPRRLREGGELSRAIATGSVVRIPNVEADDVAFTPSARALMRSHDVRSLLIVPMLRQNQVVGVIDLTHQEVDAFSNAHVELLKTFADQAVIAIENVRLFNELQARTQELTRSVDELTALGDVSRALSSTLDLETVLQTIVTRANQIAGTAGCTIWEYDEPREDFRLRASHYADEADAAVLQALGRVATLRRGQGVTTQVMERRQPVQIHDIAVEGAYESPIRRPLIEAGHRALLGVPLLSEDQVIGVLAVTRKSPGAFEPETVQLLTTFATQSALAIQNARLFLEIEDKSRQLEVASQHKSEFLANMSHELRTPLNAVIGFSEVLTERMFGELNDKQEEYIKDIHASGQHLLSLINDILDLSKIEAGRMELELAGFHLPQAIENALVLVRERALRRGITLEQSIDPHLGEIQGDERKIKQVLLNLLSNAIKFTPEGGRVEVRAKPVDEHVEVAVSDTGVGIAPEDHEAVFEEFRQVGAAEKKAEGTGLGLALARKFIELHGGRIWVKSQVGVGSTFTFTLPVRHGE